MKKQKVVMGMSGGVDSSVAALLLKEQGYDVVGLFMNNWQEKDGSCTAESDWADVQNIGGKLDIPCYSVDFSKDYAERVFSYFLSEYEKGRTPNPDVLCNREIKFGRFAEYAALLGADFIATGHYCNVASKNGQALLMKAKDTNKDQTYFLNQVSSAQLANVIFPLGGLLKPQVRKLASDNGLVTSEKKDSTGVCFIGERNFRNFLSEYLPAKPGKIIDTDGVELGRHEGLMYYTLGQRRGLGIGGLKGREDNRWYVVDKDVSKNILTVSCGEGEELFSRGLIVGSFNFIGDFDMKNDFDCCAKFRYRQQEQRVNVQKTAQGYRIMFDEKQRAVTPGQFAVLYDGERCLGGGVIEEVIF